ncbi:hypothetical protein KP509_36G030000 [Ceratopteris richardii]|uniref:Uncharacterized protein n=1 Tax=Ceratopteris richardii TaxID=49495 RepID=A0A8T2QBW0_CERRI|nr:hypothetical protein KP509_36G030000 [Ceratopteris richardii]
MQAQSSLLHLATRVFEQLQLAPDTSVLQTITVAFPDKKFDVLCLSCHTYAESSEESETILMFTWSTCDHPLSVDVQFIAVQRIVKCQVWISRAISLQVAGTS